MAKTKAVVVKEKDKSKRKHGHPVATGEGALSVLDPSIPKSKKEAKLIGYTKGLPQPVGIPGMDVMAVLDDVERKSGIGSTALGKHDIRMSSGMLMVDLLLAGGYTAGWYTHAGFEQSTKTTGALTVLASSLTASVPINDFFDYEGSTGNSLDYLNNILVTNGIDVKISEVFGVKDRNDKWLIKPRVRYHDGDTGEAFFDWLAALLRRLPDKVYQAGAWWYRWPDDKEHRNQLKASGDMDKVDAKMSKGSGKLYLPAKDGKLQALVITDSYPAMVPESMDTDDPKAGLAAVARMFSANIPRVKGRLRRKRVCVLGMNQMRKVPMAMYGPTETEPAGEALKFYSDVRLKYTSRAVKAVKWSTPAKKKPQMEEEKSIGGGVDTYRYIHVKSIKNKLSPPFMEAFLRLWVGDEDGQARGYDPVFDTFSYLLETGQITSKKRDKIGFLIEGNESKRTCSWTTFKKMVLYGEENREDLKAIFKEMGMKPMFLRQWCFRQMASGKGTELYYAQKKADEEDTEKGKKDKDDGEDDLDDDAEEDED